MSDTGTRLNGISFSRPPVLPTGGFLIPSTSSPRTLAHTPHFTDDTDDAMGGPDLISLDDGAAHSAQQRRKREDLRPWTDEDRALLRKLHLQNVSANDIARHLGRTGEAVSNMSRRLGLRRRDTALPWTNGELRTLQRMLDDGSSLKQIADATGHPRSSVADKLRRMNVKSLRFRRPWTEEERETVLSLHAAGSSLAAIAQALPDRSIDAVQQKLQELVGPAPFRSPGRTETVRAKPTPKALPTEAPAIAAAPLRRSSFPNRWFQPPPLPPPNRSRPAPWPSRARRRRSIPWPRSMNWCAGCGRGISWSCISPRAGKSTATFSTTKPRSWNS